jgi:hypothetical protein
VRHKGIILAVVVLAAALLLPFPSVRTTTVQIDAISGQVRKSTLWLGGHRSSWVESSELARPPSVIGNCVDAGLADD